MGKFTWAAARRFFQIVWGWLNWEHEVNCNEWYAPVVLPNEEAKRLSLLD